jgi:hypothetical protein
MGSVGLGECAQVDWGGNGTVAVDDTRRRLSFFVMVLAFSRRMYVEFTVSRTMERFLAYYEHAFATWGRVPSKIMVDLGPPADIDATPIRRERPVFPGVGGELVEHKSNGLRGSGRQANLGAVHGNTRTNEVGERRELSANQVVDLYAILFVSDEQVVIG